MEIPPQPLEYQRFEPSLTHAQRKTLLYYKTLENQPPTMARLLGIAMPRLLLTLAVLAGVGALGWYLKLGWCVPFAFGAGYIAVMMQLRSVRLVCRTWPVLARVMDWDEVNRLLALPPPITPRNYHGVGPKIS
jgi:hypothetical protein